MIFIITSWIMFMTQPMKLQSTINPFQVTRQELKVDDQPTYHGTLVVW
jgi:hypothetical protein